MKCCFASDLHGSEARYEKLFSYIEAERPAAVFLGGDLLPSGLLAISTASSLHEDFIEDVFANQLRRLKSLLEKEMPRIFVIFGNDDPRFEEASLLSVAAEGLCEYVHDRCVSMAPYTIFGYGCIPPSPFLFKDWERYDVSRYVDPGCVSPEEGHRSVPVSADEARYRTIAEDLATLTKNDLLDRAIMLFHAPPYQTPLDRADLDGQVIDHVPVDVHIGSIAIKRFIEERQPLITLHGHVHEAVRLTGVWSTTIGDTTCFGGAHDGAELALVCFDPAQPAKAERLLL